MRITNGIIAKNTQNYIQRSMQKLARTQEMSSTTKKIIRLSDDPNSLSQLLNIRSTVAMNEQYMRNIKDGLSYLDAADTALGTAGSLLQRILEYDVQGSNGTLDENDMAAIGEQIDKMIDELVDIANTTVGGKYIFAGTKNNRPPFERVDDTIIYSGNLDSVNREILDQANYAINVTGFDHVIDLYAPRDGGAGIKSDVLDADGNVVTPGETVAHGDGELVITAGDKEYRVSTYKSDGSPKTYQEIADEITDLGDGLAVEYEAGKKFIIYSNSGTLRVAESADGVLGSSTDYSAHPESADPGMFGCVDEETGTVYGGVFQALFDLRDNLNNGITSVYGDDGELSGGVEYSIGEVYDQIDHLLKFRVQVGARTQHFESVQDQLEDQEVLLNQVMSNLEDVDLAKVTIDLAQNQLAYNASLASGSQILQVSLLNFLK
ncbi:flagellar hook-associated protein 3 FlgL [Desulfotomaculum arcticum]|uniref:Flagellar hook-associated protein 3 FlgL n=1 Tax=Desulfotruncus arcticus DSM 17038 TaxID=1121424 RepID=A0A1I2MWA0_9FIRM|nr:flagellar hook-associated protein FlgL [Desulfotruncus arcticus]SFF95378.1 flagellar hook-associated protein 3 FlgL [Desulfotomaculum arcticum] [Desulfotruncus arcticus DSM 17038]